MDDGLYFQDSAVSRRKLTEAEFRNDSDYYMEQGHSESDFSDEDHEIMSFQLPEQIMRENNSDDEQSSAVSGERNELDDISLSPPSNLPVLLIDIEKLCGYKPNDEEESEQLRRQIREALLGSTVMVNASDIYDDTLCIPSEDHISFEYIERSKQLFDEKVAKHGTSDIQYQQSNQIIVDYPEFLPLLQDDGTTSLISTSRLWKTIIQPHRIKVVNRILVLLSECSRDILWKYQMCREIWDLSRHENKRKEQFETKRKLQTWRLETRPQQLEKLYNAREMFEIRLSTSKDKYGALCRERDLRVQNELRRRAEKGIGNGGIAGLDWDSRVTFGFGDDIEDVVKKILEERTESEIQSEQNMRNVKCDESDFDNRISHSDYDDNDSMGTNDSISIQDDPSTVENIFSIATSSERIQRRARRPHKEKRDKVKRVNNKIVELELRKKIENAYQEEISVRELLTSPDERMALAVVLHLETQLQKIDELLEKLQEEQWRDDEEGLLDEELSASEDETQDLQRPSLLDSILAMILSAINRDDSIPLKDHFIYVEKTHRDLVLEWKLQFGRLPYLQTFDQFKCIDDPKHHDDELWNEGSPDMNDGMERLTISNETDHLQNNKLQNELTSFVPDNWDDEESSDDGWDDKPALTVIPIDDISSNTLITLRPGGRTNLDP